MLKGDPKDNNHWWSTFQTAKYPAYVTLVDPDSIEDVRKPRSRVKHLLLDDVLDKRTYKEGWSPPTMEIKEGSMVLVLPETAGATHAHCVSPPWLCRVNGIWFVPGDKANRHLEPKGTLPEVRKWERTQIDLGRVAVQHFQLQVTYFYRWPDFHDAIKEYPGSISRLSQGLRNLGVAENEQQVQVLLNKRGCGNTPASHFGMRYVMYSNHETKAPSNKADGNGSDMDEENSPVPLEAVMGTAKVLFLHSDAKLPYLPAKPPAPTAAAAPSRGKFALPAAEHNALVAKCRQLAPGFICNMFLVTAQDDWAAPKLFGLTEWANGTAGANIKGRWVARSRKQVQHLLQDTKLKLDAAKAAAGAAQQQDGTSEAAAAAAAATPSEDGGVDDCDLTSKQHRQQQQQHDEQDVEDDVIAAEELIDAEAAAAAAVTRGHRSGRLDSSTSGKPAPAGTAGVRRGKGVRLTRRIALISSDEEEHEGCKLQIPGECQGHEEKDTEEEEHREQGQCEEDEEAQGMSNGEQYFDISGDESGKEPPPPPASASARQQSRRTPSYHKQQQQQQKLQFFHSRRRHLPEQDGRNSSGRQKRALAAAANRADMARKRQKQRRHSRPASGYSGDSSPVLIDSD